jgi:30S ribosomal protein S31
MGKGDKKTRRGKLFSGSFGVLRARKKKSGFSVISSTKKVVAEKATSAGEEPSAATKEAKPKSVKVEAKDAGPEVREKQPVAKQPKKPVAKKDPGPKEETPIKEK